jgi:hypothetical protein
MRTPSTAAALAAAALLAALALPSAPAAASTSASSAASEGVSASVGSVSTSFEKSSKASSGGEKKAEGPYRVTEIAAVDARPGMLRLALKAVEGDHDFALILPQATAAAQQLAVGSVIHATAQPFGVQFAKPAAPEPFFLVLHDAWFDALTTRKVAG